MTEQEIRKHERERVLACVKQWLEIKNTPPKTSKFPYKEHNTTSADVDHSSLLRRLLDDKPVYKSPPPRSYSYPNYDLSEGIPYVTDDVHFTTFGRFKPEGTPHVVVAQSIYFIVEQKSPVDMIVEWEETGERFTLRQEYFPPQPKEGVYEYRSGLLWILTPEKKVETMPNYFLPK